MNNKVSLYSDRVLYGTVTLVAANTDLRLPLAGDTLSSAREGRVRYIQCEDIRYCVPSVIDLIGGGKTRRRVGLPSLSDVTVEEAPAGGERRCHRRPSVSDLTGGEERWRRIPSVRDLTGGEETARPGAVASTHVVNVRDRHDVNHYRSAIHLIGSVWRRSRDRRTSLGAGVRTARPREGECRQL